MCQIIITGQKIHFSTRQKKQMAGFLTDHMLAVCGGTSSAFLCTTQSGLHLFHFLRQNLLLLCQLLVTVHEDKQTWTLSKQCELLQYIWPIKNICMQVRSSYALAWLRSSSFSSASFWLLSSMLSTTCFIFFTSSWSFWLLIWRSATQFTSSDVSLRRKTHKHTCRHNAAYLYRARPCVGGHGQMKTTLWHLYADMNKQYCKHNLQFCSGYLPSKSLQAPRGHIEQHRPLGWETQV